MSKTEIIVRTMLDAIAGAAPVKVRGPMCQHCYVEAEVGALKITFWLRDSITRVASAEFPDGSAIDCEGEDRSNLIEEWIPSRTSFPHWWQRMGGDARSTSQLREEVKSVIRRKQELTKSGGSGADLLLEEIAAIGRLEIYNPFSYLSAGQQKEMEDLLRERAVGNTFEAVIDKDRLERCHELANEIVARSERRGEKLVGYEQQLYYTSRGICDQKEWHFIVQVAQQRKEAIDKIVRETDFLDAAEVAATTLDKWEQERRIFSLTYGKKELYPRYQFAAGEPVPIIAEVLKGFASEYGGEIDRWKVAAWLHYPNGYITTEGKAIAPKDALNRSDDIRAALKNRIGTYVA